MAHIGCVPSLAGKAPTEGHDETKKAHHACTSSGSATSATPPKKFQCVEFHPRNLSAKKNNMKAFVFETYSPEN